MAWNRQVWRDIVNSYSFRFESREEDAQSWLCDFMSRCSKSVGETVLCYSNNLKESEHVKMTARPQFAIDTTRNVKSANGYVAGFMSPRGVIVISEPYDLPTSVFQGDIELHAL